MEKPTVASLIAQALTLSDEQYALLVGALVGMAQTKRLDIPNTNAPPPSIPVAGRGRGRGEASKPPAGRGRGVPHLRVVPDLFGSVTGAPTPMQPQNPPSPYRGPPSGQGRVSVPLVQHQPGSKRPRVEASKTPSPEAAWRSRWGQLVSLMEGWTHASETVKGALAGGDHSRLVVLILLHSEEFDRAWGEPPKLSDVVGNALSALKTSPSLEGIRAETREWLAHAREAARIRAESRAARRENSAMESDHP
jgi:hypothetical protein